MVLPLIPFIWGAAKLTALAVAAKGTIWSSARFVQHGFDFEATVKQLEDDLMASKEFGAAVRDILPALRKLRISDDLPSIIASAHAINRVVEALPHDMRKGLDKSVRLGERIDIALQQAINRCGLGLMVAATPEGTFSDTDRLTMFYFGLFLIGRSGNTLAAEHATAALSVLTEMHKQCDRPCDTQTIALFSTNATDPIIGTVRAQRVLMDVPEVSGLHPLASTDMIPLWILKALGQHAQPSSDVMFLNYVTTYLKKYETSKKT